MREEERQREGGRETERRRVREEERQRDGEGGRKERQRDGE